MAQAWIVAESDLKKVRYPRIASWLGRLDPTNVRSKYIRNIPMIGIYSVKSFWFWNITYRTNVSSGYTIPQILFSTWTLLNSNALPNSIPNAILNPIRIYFSPIIWAIYFYAFYSIVDNWSKTSKFSLTKKLVRLQIVQARFINSII